MLWISDEVEPPKITFLNLCMVKNMDFIYQDMVITCCAWSYERFVRMIRVIFPWMVTYVLFFSRFIFRYFQGTQVQWKWKNNTYKSKRCCAWTVYEEVYNGNKCLISDKFFLLKSAYVDSKSSLSQLYRVRATWLMIFQRTCISSWVGLNLPCQRKVRIAGWIFRRAKYQFFFKFTIFYLIFLFLVHKCNSFFLNFISLFNGTLWQGWTILQDVALM